MTVVVVAKADNQWVDDLADVLRGRGLDVVALESLAVAALLLVTQRVAALVIREDVVPADWEAARKRLAQMSPTTRMIHVATADARSFEQIAADCLGAAS